jgi:hypothetical protein
MKKLVSVLFALLLVGSFAFAEVAVGSWSRIIFVPAASSSQDGAENTAFTGPSWAKGARVGLGFSASSDQAGMKLDVHANGTVLEIGDQAKIWVQPVPMLKIQAGKVQEDTLRGKFDDSNILNGLAGFNGVPGKDTYFTRFYPKAGLVISSTPAEGVFVAAALDAGAWDKTWNPTVGEEGFEYTAQDTLTEDMIKTVQIGGGYTIPNIGLARAQYIGGLDNAPAWLEAAFAYTGMEGVLVDAGLKFNIGESKTAKNSVAVAGSYTKDALYALVRAYYGFGDDTLKTPVAGDDKAVMKFSTDVSYKVADPLSVGIEASFDKHDKPVIIDVLPYIQIASGAGKLKTGFLYESRNKEAGDYTAWAIPVMVEVGF